MRITISFKYKSDVGVALPERYLLAQLHDDLLGVERNPNSEVSIPHVYMISLVYMLMKLFIGRSTNSSDTPQLHARISASAAK